jgi:hypothetical protein
MKSGSLRCNAGQTNGIKGLDRVGRVVVAMLGGMLFGCAGIPEVGGLAGDAPMEARQAAVETRARARWDALIAGDYEKAYSYMTEASRGSTSLERFKGRTRVVVYRGAKIDSVNCDADACNAEIFVTYDHRKFKGGTTRLKETWVLERGQMAYVDPIK